MKTWMINFAICSIFSSFLLSATEIESPPEYNVQDTNQVNLLSGKRVINRKDLTIGNRGLSLEYTVNNFGDIFEILSNNFFGSVSTWSTQDLGGMTTVQFGNLSNSFSLDNDGNYYDRKEEGGLLLNNGTTYTYTHGSGAIIIFDTDIKWSTQ